MYTQPCLAKLDMGKKMVAGDAFFATYTVDMSARVYRRNRAKTFTPIAVKTTTVEIKAPNTDLKSLYEEDQPASTAETVTYFDKRFKFKLSDFLGDATTGRGFQRVTGGYKLYGAEGAEDRWFFNLAVELPTAQFAKGSIIYQWITYNFEEKLNALDGAVACKIEVGDYSKTSSDQWQGVVPLASANSAVAGKKWYKQQPLNKLKKS
jgi:hypothetical protein